MELQLGEAGRSDGIAEASLVEAVLEHGRLPAGLGQPSGPQKCYIRRVLIRNILLMSVTHPVMLVSVA